MKNLIKILPLFLLVSCILPGNENTGTPAEEFIDGDENLNNGGKFNELELDVSELEDMKGQHYEGWLIYPSGPVSTGRFNIKDGKVMEVSASGEYRRIHSTNSIYTHKITNNKFLIPDAFVLTIEPNGDLDESPSEIHLVAGSFSGNRAYATTDHPAALGVDFFAASGSLVLATPSNGPSTHNQGIWYLIADVDKTPSLDLPTLPAGWVYEGWIVDTVSGAINSTGTFRDPAGADSDLAGGVKAGLLGTGPARPGQDFINPGIVLNDGNHVAVISVEPYPDFDARPFSMKPLRQLIPEGVDPLTSVPMNQVSDQGFSRVSAYLK